MERNRVGIPMDQLFVITHELDANEVSIKASGIFPITYSLMANVSLGFVDQ